MNKYINVISRIENENEDPNVIVYTGSFNPNDIIKKKGSKIIMTADVFYKILQLSTVTQTENRETGCFLYGIKIDNNSILLTAISQEDFATSSDNMAVDVTSNNLQDLNNKINNYTYDCVVHIHTHPNLDNEKYSPRDYSEQALYVYGYLQKHFQLPTKQITYLGGLITVGENKEQLSFIFYEAANKTYFRISDLYYYEKTDKTTRLYSIETYDNIAILSDTYIRKIDINKSYFKFINNIQKY